MSPRWVPLCAHRVRWHIPRRICGEQARRRGRRVRETARYSRPLAVIPAARHRPATRFQAARGTSGWWSSGERRREPLGMGRLSHACMPHTTLGCAEQHLCDTLLELYTLHVVHACRRGMVWCHYSVRRRPASSSPSPTMAAATPATTSQIVRSLGVPVKSSDKREPTEAEACVFRGR
jgi:hypothetical protein